MDQTTLLLAAGLLLLAAAILLLVKPQKRSSGVVNNTISLDVACDVGEAREDIRQLTADIERMNAQLLTADRRIMGLKVRTMEAREAQGGQTPPRRSPPVPAPAKASRGKR